MVSANRHSQRVYARPVRESVHCLTSDGLGAAGWTARRGWGLVRRAPRGMDNSGSERRPEVKQNGQRLIVAAAVSLTAALMLLIIIPAFAGSGDYGINSIIPTESKKDRSVATAVATLAATAVPPTAAPATATSVPPRPLLLCRRPIPIRPIFNRLMNRRTISSQQRIRKAAPGWRCKARDRGRGRLAWDCPGRRPGRGGESPLEASALAGYPCPSTRCV